MASGQTLDKLKDETYLKWQIARREAKELKRSLRTAEMQLAKTKLENTALANNLQETDDLNKNLESSLEFQTTRADLAEQELNNARALLTQHEATIELLRNSLEATEQDWTQRSQQSHAQLLAELEELRVADAQTQRCLQAFKAARKPLQQLLTKDAKDSLGSLEALPTVLEKVHERVESLKDENSRLELDNIKLLSMLGNLKQFKDFTSLAQDSNGLTFVPFEHYKKKLKLSQTKGEWLPTEVYRILKESKTRQRFSCQEVTDLVRQLNEAWQERESNRLERAKCKFHKQLIKLKKGVGSIPHSPTSDREKPTANTNPSPFKTPTKDMQQELSSLQEEFIEYLCDKVEELCDLIQQEPDTLRSSQEWFVDTIIKYLNTYSNKLLETAL